MRKLTAAAFVSLDGVMQAPGGPTEDPSDGLDQGGWVFGIAEDVIGPVLSGLFRQTLRTPTWSADLRHFRRVLAVR
jgi:hypothetical protein